MDDNELENKLTAWWLDIAPARQEDLLTLPPPPMPWFEESIADADLDAEDVARFIDAKRNDPLVTRDAGGNPKPKPD